MISAWGVDHGDEISKADGYNPKKSFRSNGIAFDKPGARKRTSKIANKAQWDKKGWKTTGKHMGVGAASGAGVGGAIGALATRGRGGALSGAGGGAYLGAIGGVLTSTNSNGQRGMRDAVNAGLKNGDLKRRPRHEINFLNGTRKEYR